jgi:hypothetical protein
MKMQIRALNRNKRRLVVTGLIMAVLAFGSATSPVDAISLDGLRLMGADGVPLGVVSCQSIGNNATQYGSVVGRYSIWNVVGKYGSAVSSFSAYSAVASQPPALFDRGGNLVGYVSKNLVKFPRVEPKILEAHLIEECGQGEYRQD